MKDLFVLVADKDAQQCLLALFKRTEALAQFGIAPFTYDVQIHPKHDAGCRTKSVDLMRAVHKSYRYGVVLFDHEGCGAENEEVHDVAAKVRAEIARNGWGDRVAVLLIAPELENWIWTGHDDMAREIDWPTAEALYGWIQGRGWELNDRSKPERPKESFEDAIRIKKVQTSAALFGDIAEKAPLGRCTDPAFLGLMKQLAAWFPLNAPDNG